MARQDPTRDACLVVLLVGASLLAGIAFFVVQAARWLA